MSPTRRRPRSMRGKRRRGTASQSSRGGTDSFAQVFVQAPPEPGDVRTKFPYVPALDGLRGLLVFPVLLFHFSIIGDFPNRPKSILAPGSFFAPSMFFTLSGFLITSLLLIEKQRSERVDWMAFWRRRFRRLIPGSLR